MIVVMRAGATKQQIFAAVARIEKDGFSAHLSEGAERTIIGVIGDDRPVERHTYEVLDGVEKTVAVLKPFKLVSRDFQQEHTTVKVNGVVFGASSISIIAGPCSVEDRAQLLESAHAVKEAGAQALRGGAFKPRSSPYSFQGLGEQGLQLLAEAREQTGLPVVTEVMTPEQLPLVTRYADVLQIGARNMQNYELLKAVGRGSHAVLLKRGLMATVEELLMSAEYILAQGNRRVILCERGIRTFEKYTRNTTDINAVPVMKSLTHLPVLLDPSHGVGKWAFVTAVARAGIAAGADGLIVEVHPRPAEALSDGGQSLLPERFAELVQQVRAIAATIGRE
ncbi:MAG: 3-deoxy-7-phosphoheptulonate synthase [Anaerolineales bacterium]|jgi:3-deoxy-7-phosphoheptulonate synthase|nr:3-deoxy-7-phosphoheptulonate synthase [Anaerolineales bacterium]HJN40781.1 3-deoxy-7-phosphoheptulonate synthase [Anaerolineales bacterium]|tara:strand:- start:6625 stop:7635 length:1011 start_codon:yes stop_codon:yes gene_type:complete